MTRSDKKRRREERWARRPHSCQPRDKDTVDQSSDHAKDECGCLDRPDHEEAQEQDDGHCDYAAHVE